MDLTVDEIVCLFENIGEIVDNISKTINELVAVVKSTIDEATAILQGFFKSIEEQQESSKTKIVLNKLSPKNIFKRIKQFMKRKV